MHIHLCMFALCSPPDNWNVIERSTYVCMKKRLIPYPLQNNINALDPEDQILCINGLVDAHAADQTKQGKPANLDEWILRVMGTCFGQSRRWLCFLPLATMLG